MSKFGVGVGEDFPVDERQQSQDSGEHSCGDGRHEAWRRFRHQMHAEWHARRRAMRDAFGRPEFAAAMRERHLHHMIIGGLAVVGVAALLGFLRHRD